MRKRSYLSGERPPFVCSQFHWAFGDDDAVGTFITGWGVPQVPARQPPIPGKQIGIVGQQDIEPRLDAPVLESVVQDNDFRLGSVVQELWDSDHAFLAYGDRHIRE